ncbi:unnamed protein product, partial [Bubo scandiacus]
IIKGMHIVKCPLNEGTASFTNSLAWFEALEEHNMLHEVSKNLGATRVLLSQVQQD